MKERQQINIDCRRELAAIHRHQAHLARVAIAYLARSFGDDPVAAGELIGEREFDRLRIKLHGYQNGLNRLPRSRCTSLALRVVVAYIRDQAPVRAPASGYNSRHASGGGRRQRPQRSPVLAGTR